MSAEKTFLDLIQSHRGAILKVCYLYEDNSENRQDLYQEILLQLWRSFPTFRGDSSAGTWIYRVAFNTAVTVFRSNSKKTRVASFDLSEEELSHWPEQETEDLSQSLFRAIGQLNGLDKALVLLYLEDKSYQEMAEISGLSVSNVGVRLNRIKQKLSEIIKREES